MLKSICLIASIAVSSAVPPFEGEQPYLANITQLTFENMGLFKAGEAYFSPDSRLIIFQAVPIGQTEYQIYTMDLSVSADARKPRMVSTGRGACTCAFFRPDGKKIIFASSHLDPTLDQPKPKEKADGYKWDYNEHMDIFEADLDGSNLRRLTDAPGYDAEGSYSPDGRSIVFTSNRDDDLEIYVMDADGKNQRRITKGKGEDGGPFFSPDGKTVLYRGDRRNDKKQNLQLRMVQPDGTNDRALTDNSLFNWCPYWHPSGTSFIFTQADHAAPRKGGKINYDLFMTDTKGDGLTRITFEPAFDGLPVFSPDGQRLMWTSKRGELKEAQVFIAEFQMPPALRKVKAGD